MFRSILFSLLAATLFCTPVFAEEPILVIDTGGHKALIKDVMFTRDGKQLVSASNDKTVRVWDAATGEPIRTIRGQVGEGAEGMIYAAALSPDNRWLACGGWMGPSKNYKLEDVGQIRLYDFPSGRLEALLTGHTNAVLSLAFSPDGRYLASGSGDDTVRIWDLASKRQIHLLQGHTDDVYALAWVPGSTRLVSGAFDNTLILWDGADGKKIHTLKGHTDKVYSVAVSPDGRYIASGSKDKTIRLWDAGTGAFKKVLATQETQVGSLSFFPDGNAILTGTADEYDSDINICHIFEVPSGKDRMAFTRHDNIVLATAVSSDGTLVATGGGNNQDIYLWKPGSGEVLHTLSGRGRSVWSVGFSQNNDGIAWGHTRKQPNPFNKGPLEYRMTLPEPGKPGRVAFAGKSASESGFVRALEKSGGYVLSTQEGGNYGYQAILKVERNRRTVSRMERDGPSGYRHCSYTLTPDARHIVSGGASGFLTLYETGTGKKVHDFVGHTGDVFAVAVSPDGSRVVSGSADQTVRVWNLETGENLMTVFLGSDDEWVAWTPSGYYTASPGGDRYIGWQINRGPDKNPDVYKASQFAETLYRPELVAACLSSLSEKTALARLGLEKGVTTSRFEAEAPPDVVILSPENGLSTTDSVIDLMVKIDVKASPVDDVAVYVNGRQVLSGKDRSPVDLAKKNVRTFRRIPLSDAENIIKVEAVNTQKNRASAMVKIIRKIARTQARPLTGDLYLVSIGVDTLDHMPKNSLKLPGADAADIDRLMKGLEGKLFKKVHSWLFSDTSGQTPVSSDIEDTLYNLRNAAVEDTIMIFMAGHGVTTDQNDFLFLTRDAQRYDNGEFKMSSVLKWADIRDVISKINARRILFLDTCYSGGVDLTDILKKGSDSNIAVFSSSTSLETSRERSDLGHGLFTYAILKGLGKDLPADDPRHPDGKVEINELLTYVKGEVRELSGGNQTPNLALPTGMDDFPFYTR